LFGIEGGDEKGGQLTLPIRTSVMIPYNLPPSPPSRSDSSPALPNTDFKVSEKLANLEERLRWNRNRHDARIRTVRRFVGARETGATGIQKRKV